MILRSEKDGHEIQRVYSLTSISPDPFASASSTSSPLTRTSLSSRPVIDPVREIRSTWSDGISRSPSPPFPGLNQNAGNFTETFAYRVWNMLPWWPTFNIAYRTSTVVLYWTPHPASGQHRWKIAQHFATDEGPCPISSSPAPISEAPSLLNFAPSSSRSSSESAPSSSLEGGGEKCSAESSRSRAVYKRCLVPLRDPVLVPNSEDSVPILGLAYNHVGWIEQVSVRRRGRRSRKRVAMLASFPDPGSSTGTGYDFQPSSRGGDPGIDKHGGLSASTRVLDIPERVLDDAYHLIVDSSSATVSITTCGNEMYTYRYA